MNNVNVNGHPFDPVELSRIVRTVVPQLPTGRTGAIVAATDQNGITVAIELGKSDRHWAVEAAYRHDWKNQDADYLGGDVMFSW